jgi:TatD DNase family protein
MFIDAHAHLDDEAFSKDRDELIAKIKEACIYVINAGSDIASSELSVRLAKKHEFIFACVGIHPHEAQKVPENYIDTLKNMTKHPKVLAIGEIGLDYHYDFSERSVQKKVFAEQLALAKELNLPVVVHSREAHQDTLDIIRKSGIRKGLMHCYSGSLELADQYIDLGFYFSLGGTITFKNAKKPKQSAKELPLNRILLETDSPYLSPEPFRGRRNDPTKIPVIAQAMANIRGISLEEIEKAAEDNTRQLFGI